MNTKDVGYVVTKNGNGSKPEAAREYDVSGQMSVQEKLTEDLFECSKKLEDRLQSLLRQSGENELSVPSESLVPLAEALRSNNDRIANAINIINSILLRLEL